MKKINDYAIIGFFSFRCGICVGGTTEREDSTGVNECGECVALATATAAEDENRAAQTVTVAGMKPKCDCGEVVDNCGVCREKDSREWNSK